MSRFSALLLLLILPALQAATPQPEPAAALQARVEGFYAWVLQDAAATRPLAPSVWLQPGTGKPELDTRTLPAFIDRFMASGQFAPEFRTAVEQYYQRSAERIAALPAQDLEEIRKGEYGPVLETDDMDLFFCAQEYGYNRQFVHSMRLEQVQRRGDVASAEVVSSYEWSTEFRFRLVDGQWLISGYCLFQPD